MALERPHIKEVFPKSSLLFIAKGRSQIKSFAVGPNCVHRNGVFPVQSVALGPAAHRAFPSCSSQGGVPKQGMFPNCSSQRGRAQSNWPVGLGVPPIQRGAPQIIDHRAGVFPDQVFCSWPNYSLSPRGVPTSGLLQLAPWRTGRCQRCHRKGVFPNKGCSQIVHRKGAFPNQMARGPLSVPPPQRRVPKSSLMLIVRWRSQIKSYAAGPNCVHRIGAFQPQVSCSSPSGAPGVADLFIAKGCSQTRGVPKLLIAKGRSQTKWSDLRVPPNQRGVPKIKSPVHCNVVFPEQLWRSWPKLRSSQGGAPDQDSYSWPSGARGVTNLFITTGVFPNKGFYQFIITKGHIKWPAGLGAPPNQRGVPQIKSFVHYKGFVAKGSSQRGVPKNQVFRSGPSGARGVPNCSSQRGVPKQGVFPHCLSQGAFPSQVCRSWPSRARARMTTDGAGPPAKAKGRRLLSASARPWHARMTHNPDPDQSQINRSDDQDHIR